MPVSEPKARVQAEWRLNRLCVFRFFMAVVVVCVVANWLSMPWDPYCRVTGFFGVVIGVFMQYVGFFYVRTMHKARRTAIGIGMMGSGSVLGPCVSFRTQPVRSYQPFQLSPNVRHDCQLVWSLLVMDLFNQHHLCEWGGGIGNPKV